MNDLKTITVEMMNDLQISWPLILYARVISGINIDNTTNIEILNCPYIADGFYELCLDLPGLSLFNHDLLSPHYNMKTSRYSGNGDDYTVTYFDGEQVVPIQQKYGESFNSIALGQTAIRLLKRKLLEYVHTKNMNGFAIDLQLIYDAIIETK